MTVMVDRTMLGELLGPRAKLIFAATDAHHARTLLNLDEALTNVELAAFHPGSGGQTARLQSVTRVDAELVSLSSPPTGLCVLAALSPEGRAELDEFVTWWKANGGANPPEILDLHNPESQPDAKERSWETDLYHHLFRVVWEAAKRSETRQMQLQSQLYEMRVEYEQARGVLQSLQGQLDRARLISPELIHVLPPTTDRIALTESSDGVVQQFVPSSAEGLAAFDLYSPPDQGAMGEGYLVIGLQARETGESIGAWQIPYDQLGRGWFRCAFPIARYEPLHHLDMIVSWHTLKGRKPSLGLAAIGGHPELCAVLNGKKLEHSLAMLVWSSVPGAVVRLPNDVWFSPPGEEPATNAIEYQLSPRDISRFKALSSAHFAYFHPLHDITGFRLHPLDNKPALAVLRRACLPGTDRVVAVGQIRMPEARHPVEYAMCLMDAAAGARSLPIDPMSDARVVGFSGWQAVPSDGQPHAVTFELARPTQILTDLFFATRMVGGHSMTHHWADWLSVRIRLRHAATTGAEQPIQRQPAE